MPIKVLTDDIREAEFICLYGGPGTRKTNLACSVNRALPDRFGKKSIYVGVDPRANALSSVHPLDKSNMIRVEMVPDEKGNLDPYTTLVDLLVNGYKNIPDAGTIIVDTASVLAQSILQAVAVSGRFSSNHLVLESKGSGKLVVPMQGDYGAAQSMMMNLLRFAEKCPLSQLWVFHEEWVEPKSGTPDIMYGGPATVGQAIVADVEAKFMHVFRTEAKRDSSSQGGTKELIYRVRTQDHAIWKAKLRCGGKNPIPEVTLGEDPADFWKKFGEATVGLVVGTA